MQPVAKPFIDSLVWVPYDYFTSSEARSVMRQLTVTPKSYNNVEREPIKMYVNDRERKVLGLPIDFGMRWLGEGAGLDGYTDNTTDGHPFEPRRFPDPNHPKASAGQAEFMHDMYHKARESFAFLAKAPTRTGKTPVSLNTIGLLGRTALIVCPSRWIARQWVKESILHLGLKEDEVGLIQEGKADWEGKFIVPAVVHNLADNQWPEDLYRYFGCVVWDEGHRLGARMFARTTTQFHARYKWAVTATPRRKDNCEAVFLNYFGQPSVIGSAEALPMDVYVLNYRKRGKGYGPTIPLSILLNLLAKDDERNRLVAHAVTTMFDKDRQTLVVSDRVGHLQQLRSLAIEAGIPADSCGLFTRSYINPEGRNKTHTEEELEKVKNDAKVIFATYGMFKDGIDVPRLDAGIDATPRAEGEQMIGRVRTPVPGKKRPVWFTIRDLGVPQLIRQCNTRLRDYQQSGVTVHDG